MSSDRGYSGWRQERLRFRKNRFDSNLEPGLLSFVTTVWNTPAEYLKELFDCLKNQMGGTVFEWVILDNGTTVDETSSYLEKIAREPWIRLFKVKENLGIIRGMRLVLEKATGKYILPLDSDDLLTLDCARIFTWYIKKWGYPPILYSDEDKIRGQEYFEPYIKTDWDPVLFVNSCYIAHMGAISRELALELNVYTDRSTNGSHDWDTFTRFVISGYTPKHIPEIVYTWRVHPNSTSGNIDSKSYIHSSQRAVLSRFLESRENSHLFQLEYSPHFMGTPDWWIRRKPSDAPKVVLVEVGDGKPRLVNALAGNFPVSGAVCLRRSQWASQIKTVLKNLPESYSYLAFIDGNTEPEEIEWIWDAVGQVDLFSDAGVVGGRVVGPDRHMLHAGAYFGFGWGVGAPEKGKHESDPSYFAFNRKHRTVDAVSAKCMVVDREILEFLLNDTSDDFSYDLLGEELGIAAKKLGKRVIYSPFMRSFSTGVSSENLFEEYRVTRKHRLPKDGTYPRSLSLSPDRPYAPEGHPV